MFAIILVTVFFVTRFLSNRREEKENFEEMIYAETRNQYATTKAQEESLDDEEIKEANLKADNNERLAKSYAKEHPDIAADLIKAWIKSNQ